MLFRPPRRPSLASVVYRLVALVAPRRTEAADLAYLERMSNERLERDLGLIRTQDHRYRPY